MSIAIDISAAGSISSYADLVSEIRDMVDDANYSQGAIDSAIRKAEAHFNRTLRTPDMENVATLNVTAEYIALPADFLEMRAIRNVNGCFDLDSVSPAALFMRYRGAAGCPTAFAIEGQRLRFGPVGNATLDMLYYATIPQLTDAVPINWLLIKHPDAYLATALYHIARRERDSDGQQQAGTEMQTILDAITTSANSARWGAGPLTPQGISQVFGVRV
jgi:hypothetical protein